MGRKTVSCEAEAKYAGDVALAARFDDLLADARAAEKKFREAQAAALNDELHLLARKLDVALTDVMRAAYAVARAEIGPRGYDDSIFRRKAKAKPAVHAWTDRAEWLLTLRETHRLTGIPPVPRSGQAERDLLEWIREMSKKKDTTPVPTSNCEEPQSRGEMNGRAKATDFVGELLKLLPPTAGIMLALIWGLADRKNPPHDVLTAIRISSILLVVSILSSLAGLQFMVSELQRDNQDAASAGTVQLCFFLAWISFVLGSAAVIWSLFLI